MNQKELIEFAETTFKECLQLMKDKNSDYANTDKSNNAFLNLSLGEHYNVIDTEKAMWVRLSDKFSRLSTFLSSGNFNVKTESVKDTLLDTINYNLLLLAYIESKKAKVLQQHEAKSATQGDW